MPANPATTPRLTDAEVEALLALGRLVPQSRQPWQSELGLVIDAARKVLPLAADLLDARAQVARLEQELAAVVAERDEWVASMLATAAACEEECARLRRDNDVC